MTTPETHGAGLACGEDLSVSFTGRWGEGQVGRRNEEVFLLYLFFENMISTPTSSAKYFKVVSLQCSSVAIRNLL